MRERSLDEFESIFERASIPVLDIHNVALSRISAVLTGDPLDESVLDLAGYLKTRFGVKVELLRSRAAGDDRVRHTARARGFELASDPFASTAELVGQISIGKSQLVLLPEPQALAYANSPRLKPAASAVDLDALVQGTTPPILVVCGPLPEPSDVFRNVLHSLTGNFQQTQNFAYSFTLVSDGGRLVLLHTIAENEVQDVRETLQVSPDIADETGEALMQSLTHHGERYLKAVVAASRQHPFDVSYRLAIGEIVPTVSDELSRGDYGLLVVGSHSEGRSHVSADDYQLMHQVRNIPVLAL